MHIKTLIAGLAGVALFSNCSQITDTVQSESIRTQIRNQQNQERLAVREMSREYSKDSEAFLTAVKEEGCTPIIDRATGTVQPFERGDFVTRTMQDERPLPAGYLVCNALGYVGRTNQLNGMTVIDSSVKLTPEDMAEYEPLFKAIKEGNYDQFRE